MTAKGSTSRVRSRTAATSRSKAKSKSEDQAKPANVRAETHETPVPEVRETTRAEAKFIDNDPGYSAEQLDQMAEYYGTSKSTTQGEVATIETTGLAGQHS